MTTGEPRDHRREGAVPRTPRAEISTSGCMSQGSKAPSTNSNAVGGRDTRAEESARLYLKSTPRPATHGGRWDAETILQQESKPANVERNLKKRSPGIAAPKTAMTTGRDRREASTGRPRGRRPNTGLWRGRRHRRTTLRGPTPARRGVRSTAASDSFRCNRSPTFFGSAAAMRHLSKPTALPEKQGIWSSLRAVMSTTSHSYRKLDSAIRSSASVVNRSCASRRGVSGHRRPCRGERAADRQHLRAHR